MGSDYDSRKKNKKAWKRTLNGDAGDSKRVRKRRTTKRIMRGLCWSDPALQLDSSDEDMRASARPKLSTGTNLIVPKQQAKSGTGDGGAAGEAAASSFGLHDKIRLFLEAERISPLPLQARAWPIMLEGDSVYCISKPGSGKSLSFLLPIACSLADDGVDMSTRPPGPLALILVPTRELGQQLTAVSKKIRRHCNVLRVSCLTGGTDKAKQLESLKRRPHMVVATPGRLLDFLEDGSISLEDVRHVVLDEADKMLSLGFADQLERIRDALGDGARVGLFSATDPPGVRAISQVWAKAPTVIRGVREKRETDTGGGGLGERGDEDEDEGDNRISEKVVQVVHVCADHKKFFKLTKHLASIEKLYKEQNQRHKPRVLVFCNRIATVRSVAKLLQEQDKSVVQLHGDLSQLDRDAAVRDFKGGKHNILVATDVAARGLHVKHLAYVVNYDFPSNLETYVHRVGRTGRVTAEGHAYSFLTRAMAPLAGPLISLLESHQQSVDPNLVKLAESYKIIRQKLEEDGKEVGNVGDKGAKHKRAAARIHLDAEKACFVESKTFTGAKPGYVFTKGLRGLGYYLDAPKYRSNAEAAGGTRGTRGTRGKKRTKGPSNPKDARQDSVNAAKKKTKQLLPGKAWRLKGRSMEQFD